MNADKCACPAWGAEMTPCYMRGPRIFFDPPVVTWPNCSGAILPGIEIQANS